MTNFFIYYTEASVVCIIIFAIMLVRDMTGMDRQEKQIKYDHALVAFMLYFACDAVWASIIAGVLPKNLLMVLTVNFANYCFMAGIIYAWLRYVMAVEQVPGRDSKRARFVILLPFCIATVALIVTYLLEPRLLLDETTYTLQPLYSVFQISVPCVYIAVIVGYTMKRAIVAESPIERREHLTVGFFPLMVVAGGLLQILILPETPVFCFSCAILMIVFYINAMETQISTDPLTGLNNRGQLLHYALQKANLHREGRQTYVIMLDINDFKGINDTYGHAEGDRALLIIADSLRQAVRNRSMPVFLARYGGDEFILIAHPVEEGEIETLVREIRGQIAQACKASGAPYVLSTGAGYSRLSGAEDTFQACQQRADERLYLDKAQQKSRR